AGGAGERLEVEAALLQVGPVALEAAVGKDGADVAGVADLGRGGGGKGGDREKNRRHRLVSQGAVNFGAGGRVWRVAGMVSSYRTRPPCVPTYLAGRWTG